MTEDIEEKVELLLEYGGYIAAVIGYLQGVLSAEDLGHEALTSLHENGILGADPAENFAQLSLKLADEIGTDMLLNSLLNLMVNNILVIDEDSFDQFYVAQEDGAPGDIH